MRIPIVLTLIAGFSVGCTREQPRAPLDAGAGPPPAVAPAPAKPVPPVKAHAAPAATAPADDVASLLARERKLNDRCRGGSGDDPATMKACDERDVLVKKLQARGWCWGREDQIEADKKWEQCAPKGR